MPTPLSRDFQEWAHARALLLMLGIARSYQEAAFLLGVRTAQMELGSRVITDPQHLLFIREWEFQGIRGMTSKTALDLQAVFQQAYREGVGTAEIGRRVRGVFAVTNSRADMIARTESNRAGNWGRFTTWQSSGVVALKQFRATLDDRVREGHLVADGDRVPLNEPFTQGDASGMMMPPLAPNCRCTASPVTVLARSLPPSAADRINTVERERLLRERGLLGFTAHGQYVETRHVCLTTPQNSPIRGLLSLEAQHARELRRALKSWMNALLYAVESPRPVYPGEEVLASLAP